MPQPSVLAIDASTVITTNANLRQGAPNRQAPVLRKLPAGTKLVVDGVAIGEAVAGNSHWYATADGGYVWAGACGPLSEAAAQPAAPGSVVSPVVRVIDLSHGSGVASFQQARNSGLLGVIHKATTGATGRDDAYWGRRPAASQAGLLWGAYHWGTAAPVAQQVDNFLQWAQPDDEMLLALDFEATPGNQMTLDAARQFLEQVEQKVGRKPVIYGGTLLKSQLGIAKDPFWGSHRLWLAQYGNQPKVQASWSSYWLWQYSDGDNGPFPRTVPGILGDGRQRVDCDHFAGTEEELRAQWA